METFSYKVSKISYLQKWVFWVLVTLFSHVALHFVKRNTFNFYYIIFSKNYLCIHFKNSLQNSHVPDRVILWQIHFAKWKFLKMPQTAIICQLVANSGCVVWGRTNNCNWTCNVVYSKLVNFKLFLIGLALFLACFHGQQLSNSFHWPCTPVLNSAVLTAAAVLLLNRWYVRNGLKRALLSV